MTAHARSVSSGESPPLGVPVPSAGGGSAIRIVPVPVQSSYRQCKTVYRTCRVASRRRADYTLIVIRNRRLFRVCSFVRARRRASPLAGVRTRVLARFRSVRRAAVRGG